MIDQAEIDNKSNAMLKMIFTLIRFKVGDKNTNLWGFSSYREVNHYIYILIKKKLILKNKVVYPANVWGRDFRMPEDEVRISRLN